jgi:hypothetical protein
MTLTEYLNQKDPQFGVIVNLAEGEYKDMGTVYHSLFECMVKFVRIPALEVYGVKNSYMILQNSDMLRTQENKISVFRLKIEIN